MATNLQDPMCSNTKKLIPIVTTEQTGLLIQGGRMKEKAYTLTTRYAASGIVTNFGMATRIMEYEEYEESDG